MCVRAMIDNPLRTPGQRAQNVEPVLVAGWDQLDQHAQDRQRLTVCITRFGLLHGVAKRRNRLLVADRCRLGEVWGRLRQSRRLEEHAADATVQLPAPSKTDSLVDRILDEWVCELA